MITQRRLFFFFSFLFCLLSPLFLFSQGEFNNWFFGKKAAITFNTSPPTNIPSPVMNALTSTVSVSDSNGFLLFYSNGGYIYNRNHGTITGGSYMNWGLNYSQPVLAVKKIGENNLYWIFNLWGPNATTPGPPGLFSSVLDMTLNGGLGGMIPTQQYIPVPGAELAYDQLTGTRHHNNRDAWIVTHDTNERYLSYLVSSAGITGPVISLSSVECNYGWRYGEMKISQDGRRLLTNYSGSVINFQTTYLAEFCAFNSKTGVITPLFKFHPVTNPNEQCRPDWATFSPNSKLLYVGTQIKIPPNITKHGIFQYDATRDDSTGFMNSQVFLGYVEQPGSWGLQLAPDGKIYCSIFNLEMLNVINFPNVSGLSCGFQIQGFNLNGQSGQEGLPQFIQKYKAYIHSTAPVCQEDLVNFTSDIWPPADTIRWDFGDPASGNKNSSALANPGHTYLLPGTYTVQLYVRHNDNRTDTTWKTITINAKPAISLDSNRVICEGSTTVLDAGACSGCSYLWGNLSTGQPDIGTNQTYTTGQPGVYMVTVTSNLGCIGRDTIHLSTAVPPVSTTEPTSITICSGETTAISLTSVPASTIYSWVPSLISGNITGFSVDSGLMINQMLVNNQPTAGTVNYHITPKTGICSGNPFIYQVTVNPGDSVKVMITNSANDICAGIPVTFTATPVNPGSAPVFQWKVNGGNTGNNNPVFSYSPVNGDVVICELLSSISSCIAANPVTSNAIAMTVNPNLPVSVSVAPSASTVCAGTTVSFTANAVNGGALPQFQWKVNGANAGSNSPGYSYVPGNGDIVTCTLSSNVTCATGNPAVSGAVVMTVNPLLPVSVSVNASSNPFCLGNQVTFTATGVNGGTSPGYQWKVNGGNIGTISSTFNYIPSSGDVVSCMLTSSEACPVGNPATSNAITMTVNTSLPAGVSVSAGANPFCAGDSVTFTAVPVNGGVAPGYQWVVNGVVSGFSGGLTFTYLPQAGDSVWCVMTSNLSCVTMNPATSNKIFMVAAIKPTVSFMACNDVITTVNAQPFRLKGGTPLGGVYSGPGVNSVTGIFTPSIAGTGIRTIKYSYTNVATCSDEKNITITVLPVPNFTCGNVLTDVRDGKQYKTFVLPNGRCWMAENLEYGMTIDEFGPQTDNCVAERYALAGQSSPIYQRSDFTSQILNLKSQISINRSEIKNHAFYQWDELMQYTSTPATQGLCPPGWHVPTSSEWDDLLAFYNGPGQAGWPMKDTLPAKGFHSMQTGFLYQNNLWSFTSGATAGTMYWTSTASGNDRAVARGLNEYNPSVSRYSSLRSNGLGVRCCRDY